MSLREKLQDMLGHEIGTFVYDHMLFCITLLFFTVFKFIRIVSPEFNYIYKTEYKAKAVIISMLIMAPIIFYLELLKLFVYMIVRSLASITREGPDLFKVRDSFTYYHITRKEITIVEDNEESKSKLNLLFKCWIFGQGHFCRYLFNKLEDQKERPEID